MRTPSSSSLDAEIRYVRRLLQEQHVEKAKDAFLKLTDLTDSTASSYLESVLRDFYTAGLYDVAAVFSFLENLPNWSWTLAGCEVLHEVDCILRTPTATSTLQTPSLALAYFLHGLLDRIEDGAMKMRAETYWYQWIPSSVRAIVRGKPLMLIASMHNETMYAPISSFAFDHDRRNVFCWRQTWEPDDDKEKWRLIPANKQKDRFYVQHMQYEEYLYAADYAKFRRDDQGNFRSRVFTWRRKNELPGESGHWQLIPLDPAQRDLFAIYNPYQKEFLYAANDCYDRERRHVLTTRHRPMDATWMEERKWQLVANDSMLERGIEAFFHKHYARAIDYFTRALQELPDHTEHVKCYAYRMTSNLRLRKFDAITADYREIQALGGDKAAIFHGLAHFWEENTAFLEELQGPFFLQHQLTRADDCFVRKEYEVAAFFYQEAASSIVPEEPVPGAKEVDGTKSLEEAKAPRLDQIRLRRARAWLGCAKCFYALHQLDVAIMHLQNTLDVVQHHHKDLESHALLWMGKCLRQQAKYDDAMRHFERAFDAATISNTSQGSTTSSLAQTILLEMQVVGIYQKQLMTTLLTKTSTQAIEASSSTAEQSMEQMMELFNCPLSMELMVDPVMTPNGDTYEREMIERHLNVNGHFDPLTRAPLTKDMLYPNRALKTLMQSLLSEHRLGILLASCTS